MRYYNVSWVRLQRKCPVKINELRQLGEQISNSSKKALFLKTNKDRARDAAMEVRPVMNRFISKFMGMIETQLDLDTKRAMVFYWMIREDLRSMFTTLDHYEQEKFTNANFEYVDVQTYLNKIETLVCLVYDSITVASLQESKDKAKFLGALWMQVRSSCGIFRVKSAADKEDMRVVSYNDFFTEKGKSATEELYADLKKTDSNLKDVETLGDD